MLRYCACGVHVLQRVYEVFEGEGVGMARAATEIWASMDESHRNNAIKLLKKSISRGGEMQCMTLNGDAYEPITIVLVKKAALEREVEKDANFTIRKAFKISEDEPMVSKEIDSEFMVYVVAAEAIRQ